MISIGPFSVHVVMVVAAVHLAWVTARVAARRLSNVSYKAAGSLILDAVMWGFVSARLVYIAQWWDEYWAAPMSMLAIADRGFSWWGGVVVALAYIWWRTRFTRSLRAPVLAGVVAGVVAWFTAGGLLELNQRSTISLPDAQLSTLQGRPIHLSDYAGRPIVLNLWASWCPPCRREMPVLERAQLAFPDVAFVLINQGESALQAKTYLESEGLALTDVLLDPDSATLRAMQTGGLPTTFFFDGQGRLVDSHLGEITMPSLKDKLSRHFRSIVELNPDKE